MLSMKVVGAGLVFLVAPLVSSHTPTAQTFVVDNRETAVAAPCLGWRPDILDLAITGLKNSAGESAPAPRSFPWQRMRLVAVPRSGHCEVLVADERLADARIVSVIMAKVTDPVDSVNDASGIYILFEFKSDKKGERLFAGLILPLPALEQEPRGVPLLHA